MIQKIDFDDKDIAIISICAIAIVCLAVIGADAKEIIATAITAIAGLATGRKKGGGEK